jgi:hypothetical protein
MSQKWSLLRIGFLITLLVCGTAAAAEEFPPATYSATAGTVEVDPQVIGQRPAHRPGEP